MPTAGLCFPHLKLRRVHEEKSTEDEDDSEQPVDLQRLVQAGLALQKKHLRILAIDETTVSRRDMERVIGEAGHTVVAVCSAAEGLQELRKAQVDEAYGKKDQFFDLIVLGHLYHGMSVAKAIQKIRSQGRPCAVLGVANEATTEEAQFQIAGVDGIMTKPLTAAKLKKAIVGE